MVTHKELKNNYRERHQVMVNFGTEERPRKQGVPGWRTFKAAARMRGDF